MVAALFLATGTARRNRRPFARINRTDQNQFDVSVWQPTTANFPNLRIARPRVIDLSPPLLHAGFPCDSVISSSQTMSWMELGAASSCSK
jgi:hypothetical protein